MLIVKTLDFGEVAYIGWIPKIKRTGKVKR